MAGPAQEPRDLGNFKPEGGPGNQGRAAATPRRREPEHLPTVEDEFTERRARGEEIPPVRPRRRGQGPDDPAAVAAAADELDPQGAPVPARDDYEPDPAAIFGDDAIRPEGDVEPGEDEPVGSLDEYEERFLQQDEEIQTLRTQLEQVLRGGVPAGAPPGAGGRPAVAGTPGVLSAEQVTELLRYDRLLPFALNEQTAEALGMTPQGVQLFDTALRQTVQHVLRLGAALFGSEIARLEGRFAEFEPVRRTVDAQTVQQAFYSVHRDLAGYEDEAAMIWDRYARSYPNASAEQLIRTVGAATRKYVRERGIRPRGQQPPAARQPAAAPRAAGMLGPQPITARRVRPAVADGGGAGGGRLNGSGRPLSPVQRDIAQLAGLQFMH